jgi:hypothetical protein
MEDLRLLSQLSSSNYEYSTVEAEDLVEKVLEAAVRLSNAYDVDSIAVTSRRPLIATEETNSNNTWFGNGVVRYEGHAAVQSLEAWAEKFFVDNVADDYDFDQV